MSKEQISPETFPIYKRFRYWRRLSFKMEFYYEDTSPTLSFGLTLIAFYFAVFWTIPALIKQGGVLEPFFAKSEISFLEVNRFFWFSIIEGLGITCDAILISTVLALTLRDFHKHTFWWRVLQLCVVQAYGSLFSSFFFNGVVLNQHFGHLGLETLKWSNHFTTFFVIGAIVYIFCFVAVPIFRLLKNHIPSVALRSLVVISIGILVIAFNYFIFPDLSALSMRKDDLRKNLEFEIYKAKCVDDLNGN